MRKKYETSPSSLSAERLQSGLGPHGGLLRFDAKLMSLLPVEEWLARARRARDGGPSVPPTGVHPYAAGRVARDASSLSRPEP